MIRRRYVIEGIHRWVSVLDNGSEVAIFQGEQGEGIR